VRFIHLAEFINDEDRLKWYGALTPRDVRELRLLSQQMVRPQVRTPGEVVRALGAVQAQDFLASLWSIGLRLPGAIQADVEEAIASREIVRTWPMRGTLHFVPAEDARWMVGLLAPRVSARNAGRLRRMGIDDEVVSRSRVLVVEMLQGRVDVTRDEVYLGLGRSGVPVSGQRGLQILWLLAQEGLICLGARSGRQPTFVLLDEWIPKSRTLHVDDALPLLVERYFASHGPATLRDFSWWSGLKISEGKAAVQAASGRLVRESVGGIEYWMLPGKNTLEGTTGSAHLLPSLDEFIVAYKNREGMIESKFAGKMVRGLPVLFVPKIVIDGIIVGTWRRTLRKDEVQIAMDLFMRLPGEQLEAVAAQAERYGRFLGKKVVADTMLAGNRSTT
jgi:hypothetical protein